MQQTRHGKVGNYNSLVRLLIEKLGIDALVKAVACGCFLARKSKAPGLDASASE
jgi:hypothetical protein